MPSTTVKATKGQTLCQIAMLHGFLDCQVLRDAADNKGKDFLNRETLIEGEEVAVPEVEIKEIDAAIDKKHTFKVKTVPPPFLRFTHGSKTKPYREDDDQTIAGISNFPTDKAAKNVKSKFPTTTKFDQLGHDDPDAFKIEMVDPTGPAKAEVLLQALKPKIKSGKPETDAASGAVLFEDFPGAEKAKRQKKIKVEQVASKVAYRSAYLRLVVDARDEAARPAQTLLVAEMTDGKGGDADAVEILDQRVRATFELPKCPGGKKCTMVSELEVGPPPADRKRVKLALHILKDPVSGNALTTDEQLRRTLLMYMRQVYAQAGLGLKIIGAARDVVVPANMIVVDDQEGRTARGGGAVDVRIRITDLSFDQTASIVTVKDDNTEATANALKSAIDAVLPGGITSRVSVNPAIFGKPAARFSTDVLIGDPLANQIRVTVTSAETRQRIRAVALPGVVFDTGSGNERHTGNRFSRILLKNYDTGRSVVDVFVVGNLPNLLGLAFNPFLKYGKKVYGHDPSRDDIANSFVVNFTTLHTPGAAEVFYTTIPHEIGHALTDAIHVLKRPTDMMGPGSPVGQDERQVKGPKRITDGIKLTHDDNVIDTPVTMFRDNNTDVFTNWDDV
ncbi:MAG: hypothetical protein WD749_15430 [Phycisphaerales bacterium]